MAGKENHRRFGYIREAKRKLASGKPAPVRYYASYVGPDGNRYNADTAYSSKERAQGWLAGIERDIELGVWAAPGSGNAPGEEPAVVTFREYSEQFMGTKRASGRSPRTLEEYQSLLDRRLLPVFGDLDITAITPNHVRDWYAATDFKAAARRADANGGTARAHAYGLLSSIFKQAERDDVIIKSPCRIVGAATPKRLSKSDSDTHLAEQPLWKQKAAVETITDTLPEQWRIAVTLGLFAALRFGEVCALRRRDVDLDEGAVHIRRGLSRTKGEVHMRNTKTQAGKRTVHLPPSAVELLRTHMDERVSAKPDALIVSAVTDPTQPLAFSSLNRWWNKARAAAGQPDVTFHHLRHAGISLFARAGGTDRENSIRAGHATATINHHYQHSDDERLRAVADQMDVVWSAAKQPAKKSA